VNVLRSREVDAVESPPAVVDVEQRRHLHSRSPDSAERPSGDEPALDRLLAGDVDRPRRVHDDVELPAERLEPSQGSRDGRPLDHLWRDEVLTEVKDSVEVDADRVLHIGLTGSGFFGFAFGTGLTGGFLPRIQLGRSW
jgi:hypothetical protein